MKKIWEKNKKVVMNKKVENFLSADDIVFDKKLAIYDIYGSLGHLVGLLDSGLVNEDEYKKMKVGLIKILDEVIDDGINLILAEEDIHTAIENKLKKEIGAPADKLHTCRSRNDQVSVDLKLFSKNELFGIMKQALDLAKTFSKFGEKNKNVAMPGYTHMQKGMVSSVGLWSSSFSASLLDDFILLQTAYNLNNQSPLGSAAGYGVPMSINRELVAKSLGFTKVQDNYLYCQNSRGKVELAIIHSLQQVMLTINKFTTDLLIFTMGELNYFHLPDSFLTGSSIMVQKKNYDVLEILKSKHSALSGDFQHVNVLISNLPSGYNRNFQEIKKPLFYGLEITTEAIMMTKEVISNLKVNKKQLQSAITPDLLVTNDVYKLVKDGVAFRTAYQKIGEQYDNGTIKVNFDYKLPIFNTKLSKEKIIKHKEFVKNEQQIFNKVIRKLL